MFYFLDIFMQMHETGKFGILRSCFIAVFTFRDVAPIEITHSISFSPSLPQRQCFVLIVSYRLFIHSWKKGEDKFLQQDGGKRPL